jgi:hypothetical protein
MRWPIKPSKGYSRLFAFVPLQTAQGWVWLERYYARDAGMWIERWLDPEMHWLTKSPSPGDHHES